MALIERFDEVPKATDSIHEPVECGYRVFEKQGRRIVQFDTYGSRSRAVPGKVSQSIQLDEAGAAELIGILVQAFPGLSARLRQ